MTVLTQKELVTYFHNDKKLLRPVKWEFFDHQQEMNLTWMLKLWERPYMVVSQLVTTKSADPFLIRDSSNSSFLIIKDISTFYFRIRRILNFCRIQVDSWKHWPWKFQGLKYLCFKLHSIFHKFSLSSSEFRYKIW